MAEVSLQLHSCLNTMKSLSRDKRDLILKNQQEIFELKKNYQALGITISEKEEALTTDTSELEALNVRIKETQQQYKKILDSTHELMRQVKEYNPSKIEKAENVIEETLNDLKISHQEIQMTNYTIAKNKHVAETKLGTVSLDSTKETDDSAVTDVLSNITPDSKDDETKSHEPEKKKGKFSNRLKSMQKDVRNKKVKSNELEPVAIGEDGEVSLMVQEQ